MTLNDVVNWEACCAFLTNSQTFVKAPQINRTVSGGDARGLIIKCKECRVNAHGSIKQCTCLAHDKQNNVGTHQRFCPIIAGIKMIRWYGIIWHHLTPSGARAVLDSAKLSNHQFLFLFEFRSRYLPNVAKFEIFEMCYFSVKIQHDKIAIPYMSNVFPI